MTKSAMIDCVYSQFQAISAEILRLLNTVVWWISPGSHTLRWGEGD
jgi:hypothetical protein